MFNFFLKGNQSKNVFLLQKITRVLVFFFLSLVIVLFFLKLALFFNNEILNFISWTKFIEFPLILLTILCLIIIQKTLSKDGLKYTSNIYFLLLLTLSLVFIWTRPFVFNSFSLTTYENEIYLLIVLLCFIVVGVEKRIHLKLFSKIQDCNDKKRETKPEAKITSSVKENFLFLLLSLFFLINKLLSINKIGVGTDEGNPLFAIKLLKDGFHLYKDFWYREPGALLFLRPFYAFFETDLITNRIILILYEILFLTVSYFLIKRISNKFLALIFTSIIIFSGLYFPHFLGLHYVFFGILLDFSFLFFFLYLKESKIYWLLASGILTGFGIIVYKAGIYFMLLSFIVLTFKKTKTKGYEPLVFVLSSSSVLCLTIIYLSYYSSLSSVIGSIFSEVTKFYVLLIFSSIIYVLFKKYFHKIQKNFSHSVEFIFNISIVVFMTLIVFFALSNRDKFIIDFWSNFILKDIHFFIFGLAITALALKNRILKLLFSCFLVFLIAVLFTGLGKNNFIYQPYAYHEVMYALLIISCLVTVFLFFSKKNKLVYDKEKITLIGIFTISSFWVYYASFLLVNPGDFQEVSGRFTIFSYLFPIFVVITIFSLRKNNKNNIYLFIPTITALLIISFFNYRSPVGSFVLYSIDSYKNTVEFIDANSDENDYIFTADLAIAANVKPNNILLISSPWIYRNTSLPKLFCEREDERNYCFDKKTLATKIQLLKPKYIIIGKRTTYSTFIDSEFDPNNSEIEDVINSNYVEDKNFGEIQILKQRNNF